MHFLKRKPMALLTLLALYVPVAVYAFAPVETIGQPQDEEPMVQTGQVVSAPAPTPVSDAPLVSQSNVPVAAPTNAQDQIANLQQQVQQLSGELQVQQHDITLLSQQLRNFYQDLSSQIKQAAVAPSDNNTATPDSAASTSSAPTVTPPTNNPADTYKSGLNLVAKKQYPEALTAFQAYLKKSPTGHFAPDAHYWLGEIYVQMKNLPSAATQFKTVIQQYPQSDKVADAEVKLGIIHVSQGNVVQARAEFTKIKQEYPGTTASQLADIQLQQLGTP